MVLKKESTLYSRDSEGKLISEEVELVVNEEEEDELKFKGEKIEIIPMGRGEIKKMFADIRKAKDNETADIDKELVVKYCVSPKYTPEEVEHIKPPLVSIIVNTILYESGVISNKKKSTKENIKDTEDEFAKNLKK